MLNKFRKTKTFTVKPKLCPQLTSKASSRQGNYMLRADVPNYGQILRSSAALSLKNKVAYQLLVVSELLLQASKEVYFKL